MTQIAWISDSLDAQNGTWMERICPILEMLEKSGATVTSTTYSVIHRSFLEKKRSGLAPGALVIATKPFSTLHALLLKGIQVEGEGHLVVPDVNDDYLPDVNGRELRRESFAQISFRTAAILDHFKVVLSATPELSRRLQELTRSQVIDLYDSPKCDSSPSLRRQDWTSACVNVAWFGIAKNPYFRAGVELLSDHAAVLRDLFSYLRNGGRYPHLHVLTNTSAMTTRTIDKLKSSFSNISILNWSRETMSELLGETHVVFLPRAHDMFHEAKGLNRLYTALTHGSLVLTSGSKSEIGSSRRIPGVFDSPSAVADEILSGEPWMRVNDSLHELRKVRRNVRLQLEEVLELGNATPAESPVLGALMFLYVGNLPIEVVKLARVLGWIVVGRESPRNISLDVCISDLRLDHQTFSYRLRKTETALRLSSRQQSILDTLDYSRLFVHQRSGDRINLTAGVESLLEAGVFDTLSRCFPDSLFAGEVVGISAVNNPSAATKQRINQLIGLKASVSES